MPPRHRAVSGAVSILPAMGAKACARPSARGLARDDGERRTPATLRETDRSPLNQRGDPRVRHVSDCRLSFGKAPSVF